VPEGAPAISRVPEPTSAMVRTIVSSSFQVARRLATGLSSEVMWLMERVEEKPKAPALIASLT
jgi:hypothetical protein